MPSAKILEQKKAMVADLTEQIKNSVSGVIVKYEGITVEQDTKLRKEMREAGVKYKVYKNTMTGRACENVGYDAIKPHLEGMTAIALSENAAVAPAKILKKDADDIESFDIKVGFLEGQVVERDTIIELANIPSREGLICKLLGSIQSPLYGLAYALQAIIDKSGEEAPAAEEAPAE